MHFGVTLSAKPRDRLAEELVQTTQMSVEMISKFPRFVLASRIKDIYLTFGDHSRRVADKFSHIQQHAGPTATP